MAMMADDDFIAALTGEEARAALCWLARTHPGVFALVRAAVRAQRVTDGESPAPTRGQRA